MNNLINMIKKPIRVVKYKKRKRKWQINNKHNFVKLGQVSGDVLINNKIEIGKMTYGTLNVLSFGNEFEKLRIGCFCSIAEKVNFLLGGEHNYKTISTYPFKVMLGTSKSEAITNGTIIIEDDVWIGYGSIILSGVTIGRGAVIGAGTVVAKDIPPYAIYAGNKITKYRFSNEIISKLLLIDFSNLDNEIIKNNIENLYENVTENNVDEIINKLQGETSEF